MEGLSPPLRAVMPESQRHARRDLARVGDVGDAGAESGTSSGREGLAVAAAAAAVEILSIDAMWIKEAAHGNGRQEALSSLMLYSSMATSTLLSTIPSVRPRWEWRGHCAHTSSQLFGRLTKYGHLASGGA